MATAKVVLFSAQLVSIDKGLRICLSQTKNQAME